MCGKRLRTLGWANIDVYYVPCTHVHCIGMLVKKANAAEDSLQFASFITGGKWTPAGQTLAERGIRFSEEIRCHKTDA